MEKDNKERILEGLTSRIVRLCAACSRLEHDLSILTGSKISASVLGKFCWLHKRMTKDGDIVQTVMIQLPYDAAKMDTKVSSLIEGPRIGLLYRHFGPLT